MVGTIPGSIKEKLESARERPRKKYRAEKGRECETDSRARSRCRLEDDLRARTENRLGWNRGFDDFDGVVDQGTEYENEDVLKSQRAWWRRYVANGIDEEF
jgi:hypothetical protein